MGGGGGSVRSRRIIRHLVHFLLTLLLTIETLAVVLNVTFGTSLLLKGSIYPLCVVVNAFLEEKEKIRLFRQCAAAHAVASRVLDQSCTRSRRDHALL